MMTSIDVNDLRRTANERRLRDRVAMALRARHFSPDETMEMGFGLSDFARRFGGELKDA